MEMLVYLYRAMKAGTDIQGLNAQQVLDQRSKFGSNNVHVAKRNALQAVLRDVLGEPIFILLVITATLYFILGETREAIIMLIALAFVSGISLFQEHRSRNAVEALRQLTAPKARIIRDSVQVYLNTEEIVVDDIILLEDGDIVPADAIVLQSHDLSLNESILTGESLPLYKSADDSDNKVFQGTTLTSGSCIAKVQAVGTQTTLGKIGGKLSEIQTEKTPLQLQIRKFIKRMVLAGIVAFLVVCAINFISTGDAIHSLLHGLTLAMSILPEEIPVAFSTFMALGAYHLYKKHVIAKSPYTVETLGAATVICADKTGTITENSMQIAGIYDLRLDAVHDYTTSAIESNTVLEYAMWASEPEPFDHMEKSIHKAYTDTCETDLRRSYHMVHEYPLDGNPSTMTHVFSNNADYKIGCKGGLETLLQMSALSSVEREKLTEHTKRFAAKGYRVLGVGKTSMPEIGLPSKQSGFTFEILGLIAFYDPPKHNMRSVISAFYQAGIQVKMITGDYPATALSIAEQVGMAHHGRALTGADVMRLQEDTLREEIKTVNVFARMYPEAKLRIVEALKANGEVVAMTGDGVNDAPALKAAHIGIAMGKKGTETAKKAAALILADDDLGKMVDAVALGRRIYENLKKAIRYIISIHVPIILIVTLPLLFFWEYTDFFNPLHVIILELIMGPTCSIVFENEPIEAGSMQRKPRKMATAFFSWKELNLSLIQGLAITTGCLSTAYYCMTTGVSIEETRTIVFSILVLSNIFLTLVNRSFYLSALKTLQYRNRLIPIVIFISLLMLFGSIFYQPAASLFGFSVLDLIQIIQCALIAAASVSWIEIYKWFLRRKPVASTHI